MAPGQFQANGLDRRNRREFHPIQSLVFSHILTDQSQRDADLDVCLCLIGDLHYEFGPSVNHVFEDILIDAGMEGKVKQCP